MKKRDELFDILKGIGILSVVIGHAFNEAPDPHSEICSFISRFVYTYHLPIFFFVAGYFMNRGGGDTLSIGSGFLRIVKSTYLKYLLWGVFFCAFDILRGYSLKMLGEEIIRSITFKQINTYSGAMWFVPWLFTAETIFLIITFIFRRFPSYVMASVSFIVGIIGVVLCANGLYAIPFNIDLSAAIIPVMYGGYIFRDFKDEVLGQLKIWFVFPCLVIMTLLSLLKIRIEFSQHELFDYYFFYPVIAVGLVFCLSFGKAIMNMKGSNLIKRTCIIAGKSSFSIMALHLLVFKLIDQGYYRIYANKLYDMESTYMSPYSYPELRPAYIILGVSLPVLFDLIRLRLLRLIKTLKDRLVSRIKAHR